MDEKRARNSLSLSRRVLEMHAANVAELDASKQLVLKNALTVDELVPTFQRMTADFKRFRRENRSLKIRHKKSRLKLSELLATMTANVARLTQENAVLSSDLNAKETSALEAKVDVLNVRSASLEEVLAAANNEKTKLAQEAIELNNCLRTSQRNESLLTAKLEKLQAEFDRFKANKPNLCPNPAGMELESEEADWVDERKQPQEQLAAARKKIEELENRIRSASFDCTVDNMLRNDVAQKLDDMTREFAAYKESSAAALKREVDNAYATALADCEKVIMENTKVTDQLTLNLEAKTKEANELQGTVNTMRGVFANCQAQAINACEMIKKHQETIAAQTKELDQAKETITQAENDVGKYRSLLADAKAKLKEEDLRVARDRDLDQVNVRKLGQSNELAPLQQKLSLAESVLSMERERNALVQREAQQHAARITQLQTDIDQLREALKKVDAEKVGERNKRKLAEASQRKVQMKLNETTRELSEAQNKLATTESKLLDASNLLEQTSELSPTEAMGIRLFAREEKAVRSQFEEFASQIDDLNERLELAKASVETNERIKRLLGHDLDQARIEKKRVEKENEQLSAELLSFRQAQEEIDLDEINLAANMAALDAKVLAEQNLLVDGERNAGGGVASPDSGLHPDSLTESPSSSDQSAPANSDQSATVKENRHSSLDQSAIAKADRRSMTTCQPGSSKCCATALAELQQKYDRVVRDAVTVMSDKCYLCWEQEQATSGQAVLEPVCQAPYEPPQIVTFPGPYQDPFFVPFSPGKIGPRTPPPPKEEILSPIAWAGRQPLLSSPPEPLISPSSLQVSASTSSSKTRRGSPGPGGMRSIEKIDRYSSADGSVIAASRDSNSSERRPGPGGMRESPESEPGGMPVGEKSNRHSPISKRRDSRGPGGMRAGEKNDRYSPNRSSSTAVSRESNSSERRPAPGGMRVGDNNNRCLPKRSGPGGTRVREKTDRFAAVSHRESKSSERGTGPGGIRGSPGPEPGGMRAGEKKKNRYSPNRSSSTAVSRESNSSERRPEPGGMRSGEESNPYSSSNHFVAAAVATAATFSESNYSPETLRSGPGGMRASPGPKEPGGSRAREKQNHRCSPARDSKSSSRSRRESSCSFERRRPGSGGLRASPQLERGGMGAREKKRKNNGRSRARDLKSPSPSRESNYSSDCYRAEPGSTRLRSGNDRRDSSPKMRNGGSKERRRRRSRSSEDQRKRGSPERNESLERKRRRR